MDETVSAIFPVGKRFKVLQALRSEVRIFGEESAAGRVLFLRDVEVLKHLGGAMRVFGQCGL